MSGTAHRPRPAPRGTGNRGTARRGTKPRSRRRGTTLDQIKTVSMVIVAAMILLMVVGPKYGIHLSLSVHTDPHH